MNLASFVLAFAFLRERPAVAAWAAAQLALGVALLIAHLIFAHHTRERFADAAASGADMVVGASSAPISLVLAGAFLADVDVGSIAYRDVADIAADPMVDNVTPLVRGDNFRGQPILGTDRAYLQHFGVRLAEGAYWTEPMQAVLGSEAAERTGLSVGDRFLPNDSRTGEDHAGAWYEVVGVFGASGTPADQAIATALESVWLTHGVAAENGRISALLVSYADPDAGAVLAEGVRERAGALALELVPAEGGLAPEARAALPLSGGVGRLVLSLAAASILIALLAVTSERQRLIALARVMGADQPRLFAAVLLEGAAIGAAGAAAGLLLGHVLVGVITLGSPVAQAIGASGGVLLLQEWGIAFGALLLGVVSAAAPAALACRVVVVKAISS